MTNSSLRSALKFGACAALAVLTGCGPNDGTEEYADGNAAYGVRDLKKAEKLFSKSLELNPENVDALVMFARVELDLGEIAAAKGAIEKAAEFDGTSYDVALLDAEIAYHAKDYARATRQFAAVAKNAALDPTVQAMGWTGLGIVEMTCDARDLARIAFLRAIRLDRRNAAARYHLGLLYRGDAFGYLDAALEQFEIYVRLDAEASPRVQNVQRTIIPAIRQDIARRATERPGAANRDAALSSASQARAEAAVKKGTFKTARVEYDKALAADPLNYPAALGLAQMWAKTDTTDFGKKKALEYYKTACALRPSAVKTFLAAGELAMNLGQWATAEEIYSRAVAANPADISAIDGLIRALRKVGGKAKIADAYQVYRESIPIRKR